MVGKSIQQKLMIIGMVLFILWSSIIPTVALTNTKLQPTLLNNIIYVDDSNTAGPWDGSMEHPFQTIQDGIFYAESGDTVFVFSGIYYSGGSSYSWISIRKSITLRGENPQATVIRGGGYYGAKSVIGINYDTGACHISNFTIENSGTDIHDAGILINANNVTITHNIIRDNVLGIYFSYSTTQSSAHITGNIIENNNHGIFIWDATQNLIENNIIRNNTFDGINLIYGSNDNIIQLNTISGHTFPSESEGIIIKDSKDNLITQNNFLENSVDGYFQNAFFNKWQNNYWNASQKVLKIIFGVCIIGGGPMEPGLRIPLFRIDTRPAQEPLDILE
jgi:parallel beta-helix repeat protein